LRIRFEDKSDGADPRESHDGIETPDKLSRRLRYQRTKPETPKCDAAVSFCDVLVDLRLD